MSDNPQHQEFLIEAEDIVQGLNKNLRKLQTSSISSNDLSPDIVNELFRGIHSLKGIASILGFSKIAVLSHKLEDLLEDMRSGWIKLTPSLIDVLFEGVDLLIRLLADIHDKGTEASDTAPFLDKIPEAIKGQTTCGFTGTEDSFYIKPELLHGLSDHEVHRLMGNLRKGAFLYRITAGFSGDTFDEEIVRLHEKLATIGEVIALIPASGFSAEKGIVFEIIFTSTQIGIQDSIGSTVQEGAVTLQDLELIDIPGQKTTPTGGQPAELPSKSITMAVRVDIERLDTLLNDVGEIFLLSDTLFLETKELKKQYAGNKGLHEIYKASRELSKKLSLLRDDLIEVRMVPIGHMFDRLSRIVEKLSKELSKEIKVEIKGHETKLDKSVIEGLADPLMHIIRNAVDHGIEGEEIRIAAGKPRIGTIWLRAFQRDGRICIEVEDDGGGIDLKEIHALALEKGLIAKEEEPDERMLIEILFQPGFSTTGRVSEISGRGVGLDVVAKNIASFGGIVDVETEKEKGTKFSIILPLTLLIAKALIVTESGRSFAIPFNSITESCRVCSRDIKKMGNREVFNVRGHWVPLIRLRDIFKFTNETKGDEDREANDKKYVVVIGLAERRAGIVVDAIKGQREILIKPLSELLGTVPGVTGFTEIDSTRILPVLDVGGIMERRRV